eukprot:Lankesteria_metandrocarpae@DN2426_c0_g1_i1.p1
MFVNYAVAVLLLLTSHVAAPSTKLSSKRFYEICENRPFASRMQDWLHSIEYTVTGGRKYRDRVHILEHITREGRYHSKRPATRLILLMVHSNNRSLTPVYYCKKHETASSIHEIDLRVTMDEAFRPKVHPPTALFYNDHGTAEEMEIDMRTKGGVMWTVVVFTVSDKFDYYDFSKCLLQLT